MTDRAAPIDDNPDARRCDRVRLAASTSFTEREVLVLDEILSKLLRGAGLREIGPSPQITNIVRKIQKMKLTIGRQRERRRKQPLGAPDPVRRYP